MTKKNLMGTANINRSKLDGESGNTLWKTLISPCGPGLRLCSYAAMQDGQEGFTIIFDDLNDS